MVSRTNFSSFMLLFVLILPRIEAYVPNDDGNCDPPASEEPSDDFDKHRPKFKPGPWHQAHATFYGDKGESMGGACGYNDIVNQVYGSDTAALSQALYKDGQSCGACYEIKCINSPQWCKPGQPSIFITATNYCPPNFDKPSDNGGWCNPPRPHFDLSEAAFLKIAEYRAGIVPIQYRRVSCTKQGGIRFTMTGNPYFLLVLISNVGGAGDVANVQVKGKKTGWLQMKHNWGANWHTDVNLTDQSLTFRVGASDGRKSTAWHVVPSDWHYGQTFEGKNFK